MDFILKNLERTKKKVSFIKDDIFIKIVIRKDLSRELRMRTARMLEDWRKSNMWFFQISLEPLVLRDHTMVTL